MTLLTHLDLAPIISNEAPNSANWALINLDSFPLRAEDRERLKEIGKSWGS